MPTNPNAPASPPANPQPDDAKAKAEAEAKAKADADAAAKAKAKPKGPDANHPLRVNREKLEPLFEAHENKLHSCKTIGEVGDAFVEFGRSLKLLAEQDIEPVVPSDSKVQEVTLAGEGTFNVVVNKVGNVVLKALAGIGGSGIQPGDTFGEKPEQAIKLCLRGGAKPAIDGGIRRLSGASKAEPAAGESGASS
jgi:hypothetical protein